MIPSDQESRQPLQAAGIFAAPSRGQICRGELRSPAKFAHPAVPQRACIGCGVADVRGFGAGDAAASICPVQLRATPSFLNGKKDGGEKTARRETLLDYPPRRFCVQNGRLCARQAAAARGGTPRAKFLRIIWGVKLWRRILEFRRGLTRANVTNCVRPRLRMPCAPNDTIGEKTPRNGAACRAVPAVGKGCAAASSSSGPVTGPRRHRA